MTYQEAITLLFNSLPVWERAGAAAYKPGLERISAFVADASFSQKPFASIHIAGTNGKGSTASMLAAVLQSAGYRTGLFTSPHLVDFRERIRVNGQPIPEAAVVEFTERYRDEMIARGLTFFEMTTAMALWFFKGNVEIAVIETGLGGRLDSTNIITPIVSVITNIGLEHTQYLGNSIPAIAAEKAGIIKRGVPVVIGETDPESAPVFRARAAELHAPIVFADNRPLATDSGLDLAGDYQHKNVRTALAAVDVLRRQGLEIPDEAICRGLANAATLTGLRGRWEVLQTAPLVICDTAHNTHGFRETAVQIERTLASLREADPQARLFMVLGFAADKDLDGIIPLLPRDAHYILTRADTPRAVPAAELVETFGRVCTNRPATGGELPRCIEAVDSVPAAVARARELAGPNDLIYIGGSNFVVGEALGLLKSRK